MAGLGCVGMNGVAGINGLAWLGCFGMNGLAGLGVVIAFSIIFI